MVEITESGRKRAEYVNKLYDTSKTYYKSRRDSLVKYYKQYRSILDIDTSKEYYKWRSKLFIPATARAVDGWLPDIMLNLFAADPFFEVAPREAFDVIQSKIQEPLLLYQFDNCAFYMKFLMFLKQMGLYGTTWGKVFLEGDENTFEPLDIFTVFYSPKATSLKDTWIIQKNERTIGEMKRMTVNGLPVYKNIAELEQVIAAEKDTERYDLEIKKSIQGLSSSYSPEEGDDRRVELLEYWSLDRKKTTTIAGGRVEVRTERDNPYGMYEGEWFDPFITCALWPNPFELDGVGIPEKVGDIQDQLNCEVNQRYDNRNLRQNFILKVRKGAGINVRNLRSAPGAIWLTDDMASIEAMTIPDISSASSFNDQQMLENKCEEVTGVTKYVTGQSTDTRRTATEISSNVRMASKSFALHMKIIEEMALKPILRKFVQLNNNPNFMSAERVVKIVGNEGYNWMPVPVCPNFRLLGSSQLADKNLKVQQMIQFLQMVQADPTFDKQKIYRKIYEDGWGYKDFDNLMMQMPGGGVTENSLPSSPPQTMGGVPVEPTGLREASPFEGNVPMMMGGGGMRPAI